MSGARVLVAVSCHSWPEYTEEAVSSAAEAIRSARDQILYNEEYGILCVTDGGPNEERYIELIERIDGVGWVKAPEPGISHSRNTAFLYAAENGYDLVIPLDEDDRLARTFLRRTLDTWRLTDAAVVYTDFQAFGDKEYRHEAGSFSLDKLLSSPFIPATALISVGAWADVRDNNGHGYDPELDGLGWEDYLFYLELAALGHKFAHAPIAGLHYRQHAGSRSERANRERDRIARYIRDKMKQYYNLTVRI